MRICERMFWNSSTNKIYVFTFRHPAKSPLTMDGCFFFGGLGTIRSRDSPSQQYLSLEIGIDQENQRTLRNSVDDTESLLGPAYGLWSLYPGRLTWKIKSDPKDITFPSVILRDYYIEDENNMKMDTFQTFPVSHDIVKYMNGKSTVNAK